MRTGAKPETLLKNRLEHLAKAGLKPNRKIKSSENLDLLPLDKRVKQILDLTDKKVKITNMLFLVMYDIENDKVRNEVAKYLIRKGCIRIQKSVYMANLKRETYAEIHKTLAEIQQMYENNDSILMIPVSSDEVRTMKIIGQRIDIDLILGNKNLLFF